LDIKPFAPAMIGGVLMCAVIMGADFASENKGAEIILINGGKMRDIHFPHHRHQNVLGDCNVCHDLFPARAGSITELKEQGKLKKKQVMEDHCIDCHKKRKAAGKKTGPTSCARCHKKTG
jgi:hypothetical protein